MHMHPGHNPPSSQGCKGTTPHTYGHAHDDQCPSARQQLPAIRLLAAQFGTAVRSVRARARPRTTDRPRTPGTAVRNHAEIERCQVGGACQVPRHRTRPGNVRGGRRGGWRARLRAQLRPRCGQRARWGPGVTATGPTARLAWASVRSERRSGRRREDARVRCAASAEGRSGLWAGTAQHKHTHTHTHQPTNQPAPYGGGPLA